jgi:hypothetical protein
MSPIIVFFWAQDRCPIEICPWALTATGYTDVQRVSLQHDDPNKC